MSGELEREAAALNPQQRAAVEQFGPPLLILAGAGSGKTRVISTKIACLIEGGTLEPRSILAVTFTNKAADEMRQRTLALSGRAGEVMFRTFHSFGAWLLRRSAHLVGLDPRFRVCDEEDSATLLGRIVDAPPADSPASVRRPWGVAELRGLAARIARAKDFCMGPAQAQESEAVRWLYGQYDLRLRHAGAVDFGDLIMLPVQALREHPELRARLRQRFRAILVDEYQDSNRAQFELLKELHGEDSYLCVVGDDDQSIYKFRGAVVENILGFPEVFPGTTIVRLERNYRSSQSILDVAHAVVRNNRGRLGKELVADRQGGEPVTLMFLDDALAEARFVGELVQDHSGWSTAVLYRTNQQSRAFEAALGRLGVRYRVVGSVRFFDRAEVRDAVAYLALLLNPRDELAFMRVVNRPARGIGRKSQERILAAREGGDSSTRGDLVAAARRARPALSAPARKGLDSFLSIIEEARELLDRLPLEGLVDHLLASSGLREYYAAVASNGEEEGAERVENLRELCAMARGREAGADGLCALLEEAALDSGAKNADDRVVTLITLHNTKGLEFDRVIVTGLEDGIFPLVREGETDLEEERRLFYVGITRARHRLYLTSCRRRRIYGRDLDLTPSRFLAEIPSELLEGGGGAGAENAEENGFAPGCAVFHESYGRGVVVERHPGSARGSEETVVVVRFSTGKSARFVLRFSGLERIAPDDP